VTGKETHDRHAYENRAPESHAHALPAASMPAPTHDTAARPSRESEHVG
jgi:hypothetical protein